MYTTVNPAFLSVYTIKLKVVEGYQRLEVVERDQRLEVVERDQRPEDGDQRLEVVEGQEEEGMEGADLQQEVGLLHHSNSFCIRRLQGSAQKI